MLSAGVAVDLAAAVELAGLPAPADGLLSVRDYLAAGHPNDLVAEAAARLAATGNGIPEHELRLLPPVPDPDKILCIGLNYRDHAAEAGLDLPTEPMVFAKFRNCLIGPSDEIVLPDEVERVDYEAELAVVIGRRGKGIPVADAHRYIAGITVFNDVSARDLQLATSQWTLGKSVDTFGPCGPWLVTLDEIADVADLRMRTRVNGTVVQDSSTAEMVFGVAELVAYLSQAMTLEPGDLIATGTPAGVGFKRNPPVLLRAGDVVEVEIDEVGLLSNPVAAPTPAGRRPVAATAPGER
ncbi:fumarylacetoacetate hydrolase family protein [Pseudonocardia cypriaca]|uniref:fumarylacetoacetate hydrolase family protein n=1 Tax=Pseudonocardia cypriaca TaxID=882449 RepID=UPI001B8686D6|nr:fumarylacetoacetate hydrolase family protein [Pseudonocardia cypriaca]